MHANVGRLALAGAFRSLKMPALVSVGALVLVLATGGAVEGRVRPGSEVTRFKNVSVANMARGGGAARCPSGDRAIAGGAYWHRPGQNGDQSLDAWITASAPTLDAKGWYAAGINYANETLLFTVTVQCLPSTSFPAYAVKKRDVTVDFPRPGNADLLCPAGQKVVMGGGTWHAPGATVDAQLAGQLTGSAPDVGGTGWSAEGFVMLPPALRFQVTAFCLPSASLGPDYTVLFRAHASGTGPGYEDYYDCPSGSFVLGGGAFWSYPNFGSSFPSIDARGILRGLSVTGYGTAVYVSARQNDLRLNGAVALTEVEVCVKA